MDTTKVESQDVMKVSEAARFLGVTYTHLKTLIGKNQIPHMRLGTTMKGVRIYKPTLIKMLEGKA